MPIRDLELAGSNRFVARLLSRGADDSYIRFELIKAFPNEASQTYTAAIYNGHKAFAASEEYDQSRGGIPVTPQQLPSSGGAVAGYRYYVLVSVESPSGRGKTARYHEQDSATLLTAEQLRDEVTASFSAAYPDRGKSPDSVPVPSNFVITDIEVISVEKR